MILRDHCFSLGLLLNLRVPAAAQKPTNEFTSTAEENAEIIEEGDDSVILRGRPGDPGCREDDWFGFHGGRIGAFEPGE